MPYIERHAESTIGRLSKEYPIVMVTGQRQAGKTTMLMKLEKKGRTYVSLDSANERELAKNDPELFFEKYKAPLIIDEFQRAPQLLLTLKNIVDKKRKYNVAPYWLTGSQNFLMMKNVSESLVGRVGILQLSSFSSREIEKKKSLDFNGDYNILEKNYDKKKDFKTIDKIFEKIFLGGMPRYVVGKINRDDFFMDYINLYLNRDVRELTQVGNIDLYNRFLIYMAGRTAQELVYDEIAKNIGISAPTAKAWVSILEASGMIYILRPYYNNITKRLVKTPKIYFMDTGIASYLCGYDNSKTLMNGPLSGAFFETYVVTEIIKNYYNLKKRNNIYYYRDIDKREVDIIFDNGDSITPVEIKMSKKPEDMEKGYKALNNLKKKINKETVLCLTDDFIPYSKDIMLCPVSSLL